MRLKVLVIGDNPASLVSDCQLLRDRGLLVFKAHNLNNLCELVNETKPDVVFFYIDNQCESATYAYNEFVNSIAFTHIPVIYTLSDDEVYLITRKRNAAEEKRTIISNNIIGAVKMALRSNKTYQIPPRIYNYNSTAIQLPVFPARA